MDKIAHTYCHAGIPISVSVYIITKFQVCILNKSYFWYFRISLYIKYINQCIYFKEYNIQNKVKS